MYIVIAIVVIVLLIILYKYGISSGGELGGLREFSPDGFRDYNGVNRKEVYIGCKGYVFDATKSTNYRPGGHYHLFAGYDASVALGKMSLDPVDLETNDISVLKDSELSSLDLWFKQFKEHYKYPIVGKIVNPTKKSN